MNMMRYREIMEIIGTLTMIEIRPTHRNSGQYYTKESLITVIRR